MTQDDEVRAMEIATQLVLGPLSGVDLIAIKAAGNAIVDLWQRSDNVEDIRAVGELLEALTERDRKAIARGEKWCKRSRALSQGEARAVLRGMSIAQMEAFAWRWEYSLDEVIEWAREQREIHGGALGVLGDREEMAKITGGER